jgi:hypothetical protein
VGTAAYAAAFPLFHGSYLLSLYVLSVLRMPAQDKTDNAPVEADVQKGGIPYAVLLVQSFFQVSLEPRESHGVLRWQLLEFELKEREEWLDWIHRYEWEFGEVGTKQCGGDQLELEGSLRRLSRQ